MALPYQRVAIIGVGLIGGSFGLALKKHLLARQIAGAGTPTSTAKALQFGVIDEACDSVQAAVTGADLVFLSAPVMAIFDLMERACKAAPAHALITDAGSTKEKIVQRALEVFEGKANAASAGTNHTAPTFIGGHPMAGKEQRGVDAASADLFEGATWALTPWHRSDLETSSAKDFVACITAMGASPLVLDAAVHDEIVAWTSHLPQLAATALAATVGENVTDAADLQLAGGGLRDTTRLAGSPYRVWRDICLTNGDNIRDAISALIEKLELVRDNLNRRELEQVFHAAQQMRDSLQTVDTKIDKI